MSDMIGLLRFGMPMQQVAVPMQPGFAPARVVGAVTGAEAKTGSQTAGQFNTSARPAIQPQFFLDYRSASEGKNNVPTAATIVLAETYEPDTPTGPPPTFDLTLLELESHLRLSLARIAASRNAADPVGPPQIDVPDSSPIAPDAVQSNPVEIKMQQPEAGSDSALTTLAKRTFGQSSSHSAPPDRDAPDPAPGASAPKHINTYRTARPYAAPSASSFATSA